MSKNWEPPANSRKIILKHLAKQLGYNRGDITPDLAQQALEFRAPGGAPTAGRNTELMQRVWAPKPKFPGAGW